VFRDAVDAIGIDDQQFIYLTADEIYEGLKGRLSKGEAESRAGQREKGYAMIMMEGIIGVFNNQAEERGERIFRESDGMVKGIGLADCMLEGYARVIRRKEDIDEIRHGEIIIAPTITGDYPFQRMAAIVAEEGSFTSHPFVICRHEGIPVIVRASWATRMFETGDYVMFDGHAGTLSLHRKPS